MRYLFGDSTESNLDFNYLAFLREVIDCAVVLVECDVKLAALEERKRTRERETEATLAAIAEFGRRAADFVGPVAQQQAGTAVGRTAAAIAAAIRDAVDRESNDGKSKLGAERTELTTEAGNINKRAKEALGKLLKAHDLPAADRQLEVMWNAHGGVKATMRQRTSFGIDAVMALEIPQASFLFTPDLRVDRVAEGVQVHAREAGGWLNKGDKLVPLKLGRYHVASISIEQNVKIVLRADGNAGDMTIVAQPSGQMAVIASGGPTPREVVIEERDKGSLQSLVDKLEAATQALAEARGNLVGIEIDGKHMAEHGNPRVVAERLAASIGPTVQKIKTHSRSPGELVLRRLLGDNRREEIFVSIDELVKKLEVLPAHSRSVFAPLQLQGESDQQAANAMAAVRSGVGRPEVRQEPKVEVKAADLKPAEKEEKPIVLRPADIKAATDAKPSDGKADDRPKRTTSSPVPMPDRSGRTSPSASPVTAASSSPSVPMATTPTQPTSPVKTADDDEWPTLGKPDSKDASVEKS
jgi:hypothetical protein